MMTIMMPPARCIRSLAGREYRDPNRLWIEKPRRAARLWKIAMYAPHNRPKARISCWLVTRSVSPGMVHTLIIGRLGHSGSR